MSVGRGVTVGGGGGGAGVSVGGMGVSVGGASVSVGSTGEGAGPGATRVDVLPGRGVAVEVKVGGGSVAVASGVT